MLRNLWLVVSIVFLLTGCGSSPTEVLIASKPSGAVVFMDDVEIGTTPMKVVVDKKVSIEIHKNNFVSYQTTLSEKAGPNLLIKLEPVNPDNTVSELSSDSNNAREGFQTLAQLKHLYNTGQISRSNYDQRVRKVRSMMDMALRALKAKYKRGEISKTLYNQRYKQIKYKYQG